MTPALDDALRRLQSAVGQLEAATAQRSARDEGRGDLEVELQIMGDDRARLAAELEGATARLARLDDASEHAVRRLDAAMDTVRAILSEADAAATPGEH